MNDLDEFQRVALAAVMVMLAAMIAGAVVIGISAWIA
jgi:hypothetical protein